MPARVVQRVRAGCWAALVVTACRVDPAPTVYPPSHSQKCADGDALSCLFAAEDTMDRPKVVELATRACKLDPGHACVRAAGLTLEAHDHTYAGEKAAHERSFALLEHGCAAHDAEACAGASRMLFREGRCQEVPALLAAACAAEHPASCRELGRAALLGCSDDADLGLARERLDASCAADDREACFLAGFLALRPQARDPELARAAFTAGCAGEARCESLWIRDEDPEHPRGEALAMVRSRWPNVVDHVGLGSPVPYSEVTLSVLGPFELGRVSIGGFGVAGGAAFDVGPGTLSFYPTADFRMQTEWGPGDLVLVHWEAPDPARSAATCEADYACKHGYCSFAGGTCVRASAADCARLPECGERGLCGWEQGRCVATPEGCRASKACASRGACEPESGYCH